MFKDRSDAAQQLAQRLLRYRGQHPLILAIPRGAVPMGQVLATALQGDLDVVLVHKLCAPFDPEVAIGAIDETGRTWLAPHASELGATAKYVQAERQRQLRVLHERRQRYTPIHAPMQISGRLVIVVDDGVATGATMIAALTMLQAQGPARLVCAVAVASAEALSQIRPLADEVICLSVPVGFQGVGQYYERFEQVDDDEVMTLLHQRPLFSEGPSPHPAQANTSASASKRPAASLAASKGCSCKGQSIPMAGSFQSRLRSCSGYQ